MVTSANILVIPMRTTVNIHVVCVCISMQEPMDWKPGNLFIGTILNLPIPLVCKSGSSFRITLVRTIREVMLNKMFTCVLFNQPTLVHCTMRFQSLEMLLEVHRNANHKMKQQKSKT